MKILPTDPVVSELVTHQGTMSDAQFAKRWLTVSPTTWFRIRTGEYMADDHASAYTKLTSDLRALQEHLIISQGRSHEILPLEHVELSLQALRMAFAESRNRLVVVLSETGGGKTTITRAIEQEFPGRVARAEATEPWRQSYLAGIHAVGEACGLHDLPNNSRAAESRLIKELVARPRIIVIDEGNYFGPATLNLVKAILNLTGSTVFITSLPVLWQRMKQHAWHAATAPPHYWSSNPSPRPMSEWSSNPACQTGIPSVPMSAKPLMLCGMPPMPSGSGTPFPALPMPSPTMRIPPSPSIKSSVPSARLPPSAADSFSHP